MKKIMKVAVLAMVTAACGSAAFAELKVNLKGSADLWGKEGFNLNNHTQEWPFLMEASADFEQYGADLHVSTGFKDGDSLTLHGATLWLKPINMFKISMGTVGGNLYTEGIEWWRHAGDAGVWGEDKGMQIDIAPLEGLSFAAAAYTGIDARLDQKALKKIKYGGMAKYELADIGTISASAMLGPDKMVTEWFPVDADGEKVYDDDGEPDWDESTGNVADWKEFTDIAEDAKPGLTNFSFGFDTYFVDGLNLHTVFGINFAEKKAQNFAVDFFADYTRDKFNAKFYLPVVAALEKNADDKKPVELGFDVRAGYDVSIVEVFGRVNQASADLDGYKVKPAVSVGITKGYDNAFLELAYTYDMLAETWSIPVSLEVNF